MGNEMRESRRQKALEQIDKLEKALRNIGFLKEEIKMVSIGKFVSVNDFLHDLYHAIKK